MNRRYRPRALYLWLALLTFLAVFAATAGARETVASGPRRRARRSPRPHAAGAGPRQ